MFSYWWQMPYVCWWFFDDKLWHWHFRMSRASFRCLMIFYPLNPLVFLCRNKWICFPFRGNIDAASVQERFVNEIFPTCTLSGVSVLASLSFDFLPEVRLSNCKVRGSRWGSPFSFLQLCANGLCCLHAMVSWLPGWSHVYPLLILLVYMGHFLHRPPLGQGWKWGLGGKLRSGLKSCSNHGPVQIAFKGAPQYNWKCTLLLAINGNLPHLSYHVMVRLGNTLVVSGAGCVHAFCSGWCSKSCSEPGTECSHWGQSIFHSVLNMLWSWFGYDRVEVDLCATAESTHYPL